MSSFMNLSLAAQRYLNLVNVDKPVQEEKPTLDKTIIVSSQYLEGRPTISCEALQSTSFEEENVELQSSFETSCCFKPNEVEFPAKNFNIKFAIPIEPQNFCSSPEFEAPEQQNEVSLLESPRSKRRRFSTSFGGFSENEFNFDNNTENIFKNEITPEEKVEVLMNIPEESFCNWEKTLRENNSYNYATDRSELKIDRDEQSSVDNSAMNEANNLDFFNLLERTAVPVSLVNPESENDQDDAEVIIDETMVPETVRSGLLEKTFMETGKINLSTFYSAPRSPPKKAPTENYSLEKVTDWRKIAESIMKIDQEAYSGNYEIGKGQIEIEDEDPMNFDGIRDSIEEMEKSFQVPDPRMITSTPLENRSKTESNLKNSDSQKINLEDFSRISRKNEEKSQKGEKKSQENVENFETHQNEPSRSQEMVSKKSQTLTDVIANFRSQLSQKSQNQENFQALSQPATSTQLKPKQFSDPIHDRQTEKEIPSSLPFCLSQYLSQLDSEAPKSSENKEETDAPEKSQNSIEVMIQENPTLFDERRRAILKQIEQIFISLLKALKEGKPLCLKIRTIKSWSDCKMTDDILSQNEQCLATKTLSFGNKTTNLSFSCLVVVMCECYKLLSRNMTCTKRELYYRKVDLFQNQGRLNSALTKLCSLLDIQEHELGILSSSKGLISGDLTIFIDDEVIDCKKLQNVPGNPSAITSFESKAEFVLVVEKDTVFQRLVNDSNFKQISHKVVLITAKGYPDVNTRILLKKISTQTRLPIYILVDADPHGIEIMCTYKFGSIMKIQSAEFLAVPSIEWIGIHPTDIETLDVTKIDLTEGDLKKVDELLQRPYINPQLTRELNCLKEKRFKAEIEGIYHFSTDYLINDYIPQKIQLIEPPPILGFDL